MHTHCGTPNWYIYKKKNDKVNAQVILKKKKSCRQGKYNYFRSVVINLYRKNST